jgi:branched-chain amino acid aminotransferase
LLLSGCRRITLSVRAAAEVMPMRAIGQHNYTLGAITEILIKDDQALVRMSPKDVARVAA